MDTGNAKITQKTDIKSLPPGELAGWAVNAGEKKFRAQQLYRWMHVSMAGSLDEMSNIPGSLKDRIRRECTFTVLKTAAVQESKIDGTRKYLFELEDGNMVESVLMRYRHGNSVCISSQAGCRMGCRFCASAIGGLIRNLTPAEMLDQVYRISRDIDERISNVVVMGTGEPLDNYDNLLTFIKMITGQDGQNISQRNITVSTCGIVPGIRSLAREDLSITLALSLHASTQEKRETLMPVARKYNIEETVEACRYYFNKTGRRMTFEYSLIAGENDSDTDARQLAKLLLGDSKKRAKDSENRGSGSGHHFGGAGWCHVNLIPVNPVRERNFARPDASAVAAFKNKLENYGINVTIRRELGADIDGACGQLRRRYSERRTQ